MEQKPKLYLAISSRDGNYNDRVQKLAEKAGWTVVFPSDKARRRGSSDIIVEESLKCQNGLVIWSSNSANSRFLQRVARRLAAQNRGISLSFDNVSPVDDCELRTNMKAYDEQKFWAELEDSLRYEASQDFSKYGIGISPKEEARTGHRRSSRSSESLSSKAGSKTGSKGKSGGKKRSRSSRHVTPFEKIFPWLVLAALAAALYLTNWMGSGRLHQLAVEEATRDYPELFPDAHRPARSSGGGVVIE